MVDSRLVRGGRLGSASPGDDIDLEEGLVRGEPDPGIGRGLPDAPSVPGPENVEDLGGESIDLLEAGLEKLGTMIAGRHGSRHGWRTCLVTNTRVAHVRRMHRDRTRS